MTKDGEKIKEEILALTNKDFKYMNEKIDNLDKKFDKFDGKVDAFITKVETTYATKQEVESVKNEIINNKQQNARVSAVRIQQWGAIVVAAISFFGTLLLIFYQK